MSAIAVLSILTIFLSILVIFVNGWTDAPSSVFSVVSSGTLKFWQGVALSAVFNFFGVLIFSLFGNAVTKNVLSLTSFENENSSKIACFSCFFTVVLFGIAAWIFGMPSSESHALLASLAGASFAFGIKSANALIGFLKILAFMIISCVLAFFLSFFVAKALKKRNLPYKKLLIMSSGALSFMHGGQDGQKFIAIMLILFGTSSQKSPLGLTLLVSVVIAAGTLLGGKRIIKSLSKSIEKCDTPLAFSSDLASFCSLFICSILGMPISSGNVKSMSLVGASIATKGGINKKIITEILLTSVITFPVCFIIGFLVCKILALTLIR